jgi:membrane protein implicated in regulation of membrane protease activity
LSRMVSLAAIVAAVLSPVIVLLIGSGPAATGVFLVLAVLAVVRHHSNIRRILEGSESRIGEKKAYQAVSRAARTERATATRTCADPRKLNWPMPSSRT